MIRKPSDEIYQRELMMKLRFILAGAHEGCDGAC